MRNFTEKHDSRYTPRKMARLVPLWPVVAVIYSRWNARHPNRAASCGTALAGSSSSQ